MSLLKDASKIKFIDEMKFQDYDKEPIDTFGKNMLLKMGWKENEPIKGKPQAKPYELKPRNHRLGLGATPLDPTKHSIKYSDADKIKKEKEKNYFGTKIKVIHGKHKGLKAIIAEKIVCEDLQEYIKKNDYVNIELKVNKEILKIETKNIKLRSKKDKKKKQRKDKKKYDNSSSDSENKIVKFKDEMKESDNYLNKKTNRKNDLNNVEYNQNKSKIENFIEIEDNKKINWVIQNILIRIINKKSKFYNTTAYVVDLPNESRFTLLNKDRILIENVTEKDIETVIPEIGEHVVILKGKEKGEFAELIEKDNDKNILLVRLLNDFSIKNYKFEECCTYENL